MAVRSINELKELRDKTSDIVSLREIGDSKSNNIEILVGLATCGIAAGGKETYAALEEAIQKNKIDNIKLVQVGCIGSCYCEPTIQVNIPGKEPVLYGNVDQAAANQIIEEHIIKGNLIEEKRIIVNSEKGSPDSKNDKKQLRIALRNCGSINPEDINEYIAFGGYEALAKALTQMTTKDVINTIKDSGLRGRGGGGFPTGLKWDATAQQPGNEKYIICNADEGDPGAFMDRSILEGDPHSVIEAMTIGGYATGANNGVVYIRAEYPLAIQRLQTAIKQAEELGFLGKNIFNSGFDFHLDIKLGAGAFVCGEETALIHSVEGCRGEPTKKPPFPSVSGYRKKPTTVNNVETFANIVPIVLYGADWFSSIGTEKSKGTKVFAIVGKVNKVGLVEVPMGTTLNEIIYDIGGGIVDGKDFKAVQTGGPSGGVITKADLNTPIDYESLKNIGSMMGSGGMIVMDETNCMVNIAKFYFEFTQDESCGKCTPCRIGTKRMFEMLEKITNGQGEMEDLDKLSELGRMIKDSALCGLGQTAPNPVLSTLKYFRDEYEAHVKDKRCLTGTCKGLSKYSILIDKCIGCTACVRVCPVNCISGKSKEAHFIDEDKCISCGACFDKCKFDAIVRP